MDLLDLHRTKPTYYGAYNACLIADVGSLSFLGTMGEMAMHLSCLLRLGSPTLSLRDLQEVFWREYV